MLIVRRLLQVAFGLVVAAVLVITVRSPDADLLANLAFVGFFVLIILVLGPWWPSSDKTTKWKLDLPTDDPRVALPLLAAALGAFSFFEAWDAFTQPNPHLYRFEVLIARLFGVEGVALAWTVFGAGCFAGAWRGYRRLRSAQKNVA